MELIRSISLVNTPALIVIYAIALLTTLVAAWGFFRAPLRRRTTIALIIALILGAIAWFILAVWPKPFPETIPPEIYIAGTAAAFVLVSAFTQRGRRVLLAILAVIAMGNAYLVANLQYQQFPTVGSFDPTPVTVSMNLDEFNAATQPPQIDGREVGALVTVPLPPMRDAVAYVPPAYWHNSNLPVLVLMAGNPGEPGQWFTVGQGSQTADDFQSQHGGESPVIISVDATGTFSGNPACVDGPEYQVQTYLSQTVPAAINQTFNVNPDQSKWTIGGLSYGGTCALQVVTNHPQAYGMFLDFSGQAEPSIGSHKKTVDAFFGGDEQAFADVNPANLLRKAVGTNEYSHLKGIFIAGDRDTESMNALATMNQLAQAAGMTTTYSTVPGGHSYSVWRQALRQSFEEVAQFGGIQ
ncbi:alpha/beta hydrolase [Corynebacterium lubricantis]|uniref:alpha/beta hydrolase n=1 Tax=Corynebacterium lubricantis TaxID=541095 RepID=UPI00037E9E99|nr:alpha/beta hydrolase-fold protein [Corynebacterium lubricantis]